jgi:hypothetical protein
MINAKLQNIIDTKSAIGNAIVNKGGTITSETPFFNYAAQIDGISTGTPQTIFAASDGSKWALTNVVNLTNVSNNVTHDFNYWQPANNSTSDPILNIGTVGANISGNIQLVPVNQVNISQYVNIVATDTLGGKYEGFNGYDFVTNPTPTGNTTFNRWLLNNSASGTVLFANATFTTGTYNGPNTVANEANMAFVNNSANFGGGITDIIIVNGNIYVGGSTNVSNFSNNGSVKKYHESNFTFQGNTVGYGSYITDVAINNGFIYAVGAGNFTWGRRIIKYGESNLTKIQETSDYGGSVEAVSVNNGFVFIGGYGNQRVLKYHESNLAFSAQSNPATNILTMVINNGFVYVGTDGQTIRKFHESNLVFVGNTVSYGGAIISITTNNGFIYAGGVTNRTVQKFYESNLVRVGNTNSYDGDIYEMAIKDGFIYAGGRSPFTIKKFNENNLSFVGNTVSYGADISAIAINNGFIYAGGGYSNQTVNRYNKSSLSLDNQTFYTATKIKE